MSAVLTLARLVLVAIGLVFWLLELSALAGFVSNCSKVNSLNGCNVAVGLEWWAVWLQFFVFFPVAAYTLRPTLFGQAHTVVFTFVAMNCAVSFQAASKFVTLAYTGSTMVMSGGMLNFYRVGAAGFITCLFCTFLWLILTGVELSFEPLVAAAHRPELPPVVKSDLPLSAPVSSNPYIPSNKNPYEAHEQHDDDRGEQNL